MNRMAYAAAGVVLAGVAAFVLGAGAAAQQAPQGPQPVYAATGERTLGVPAGNYTLLVFTNSGPAAINAALEIGGAEMAFTVQNGQTLTLPLGAATSIPGATKVKYKVATVAPQPADRTPAGQNVATLAGWGAADGRMVAFAEETATKPRGSATNGAKPNR